MGEIRDAESAEAALHLSETGHLVFGTLHSTNANQSVERMLQFFAPDRAPEILSLLAFNLRGIVSQRLIRGVSGQYSMAAEILMGTPRVRELLRRNDVAELKTVIQQGDREGMKTFDQALFALYDGGLIDAEVRPLRRRQPERPAVEDARLRAGRALTGKGARAGRSSTRRREGPGWASSARPPRGPSRGAVAAM